MKRTVGIWEIEVVRNRFGNLSVYVGSWKWSDSGLLIDGRLLWDFPERIPKRVKGIAKSMLVKAKALDSVSEHELH